MVPKRISYMEYPISRKADHVWLFRRIESPDVSFPIQSVRIVDLLLQDRFQSYLYAGRFKKIERIFPMARQTVNRHIHGLVQRVGGGFAISCHIFRHSFAVDLILHGWALKVVSQLLGHRSIDSTEIYTSVS